MYDQEVVVHSDLTEDNQMNRLMKGQGIKE